MWPLPALFGSSILASPVCGFFVAFIDSPSHCAQLKGARDKTVDEPRYHTDMAKSPFTTPRKSWRCCLRAYGATKHGMPAYGFGGILAVGLYTELTK
eukprot:2798738-Amphidinium_carterae.1